MNCKPGDLAIVVRSECGNEGKILRVLRLSEDQSPALMPDGTLHFSPWWETDNYGFNTRGELSCEFQDDQLLPIRDGDGEDETLTWAGLPHKETA